MRIRTALGCLTLLIVCPLFAAEPAPPPEPGAKMLDAYFRHRVKEIAEKCLTDVKTREVWEKGRPVRHRQLVRPEERQVAARGAICLRPWQCRPRRRLLRQQGLLPAPPDVVCRARLRLPDPRHAGAW